MSAIPPDIWKRVRTKLAARIKRRLHVTEVNPGPEFRLRFDYLVTAAEVATIVEDVMRETERLTLRCLESGKK